MVYNMDMDILLLANNLSEGAVVALKMMAGVVIAAVLLYLVLVLSRVLGTKLEHKKYLSYCEKYVQEHGSEEGMLSEKDYIETRASGNAVVWKRQNNDSQSLSCDAQIPQSDEEALKKTDNSAESNSLQDTASQSPTAEGSTDSCEIADGLPDDTH